MWIDPNEVENERRKKDRRRLLGEMRDDEDDSDDQAQDPELRDEVVEGEDELTEKEEWMTLDVRGTVFLRHIIYIVLT
jgi:hypothetical protein